MLVKGATGHTWLYALNMVEVNCFRKCGSHTHTRAIISSLWYPYLLSRVDNNFPNIMTTCKHDILVACTEMSMFAHASRVEWKALQVLCYEMSSPDCVFMLLSYAEIQCIRYHFPIQHTCLTTIPLGQEKKKRTTYEIRINIDKFY